MNVVQVSAIKSRKTLRRPENWQDFETLCKKLWGEMWRYSEIKKNGRSGQAQSGVDIYGIPYGGTDYIGIQCKRKDEYIHKAPTIDEIRREAETALSFKPPLRNFYFATTSVKDATLEEVRLLDREFRANGRFGIHLFSWEDIVELIDENRATHDWYVKEQRFQSD